MWASAMGHTNIVNILLKSNANLEDKDKDGYTALHWVKKKKFFFLFAILRNKNVALHCKQL